MSRSVTEQLASIRVPSSPCVSGDLTGHARRRQCSRACLELLSADRLYESGDAGQKPRDPTEQSCHPTRRVPETRVSRRSLSRGNGWRLLFGAGVTVCGGRVGVSLRVGVESSSVGTSSGTGLTLAPRGGGGGTTPLAPPAFGCTGGGPTYWVTPSLCFGLLGGRRDYCLLRLSKCLVNAQD